VVDHFEDKIGWDRESRYHRAVVVGTVTDFHHSNLEHLLVEHQGVEHSSAVVEEKLVVACLEARPSLSVVDFL
jgi:hypothetical protein